MTQSTQLQVTEPEVETKPKRIMRSYKYLLQPTPEQEILLKDYIAQLRDIWNHYVKINKMNYEQGQKRMNWIALLQDHTLYKQAYPDAYDLPRTFVTAMAEDLEQSYLAAYARVKKYKEKKEAGTPLEPGDTEFGFPRFRNSEFENNHIKSKSLPEHHVYGTPGYITFPNLKNLKYLLTRPLPEPSGQKYYSAVISFKGGKWQVVIQVEVKAEENNAPARSITIRTDRPHGIALEADKLEPDYRRFRQRVMLTYKNWQRKQSCRQGYETKEEMEERIEHNKTCPRSERILAPKKSSNYRRAHANLTRLGNVLRNIHHDYLHKLANHLVRNYRHIHVDIREWEHLRIKNVIDAEADLHQQNCGEFVKILEEKLQMYPKSTLKVTKPMMEEIDELTNRRYRVRFAKMLEGRKWKEIHTAGLEEYKAFKRLKKKREEEAKKKAEAEKAEAEKA